MKLIEQIKQYKIVLPVFFIFLLALPAIYSGCKKETGTTNNTKYVQVNLVSDTAGFGASSVDPALVNPWGLIAGSTGAFWIADNGTGLTSLYNSAGVKQGAAISIPFGAGPAAPSGVIYNTTTGFNISSTSSPALFIYCTEDGILSAWNSATGATCVTVADQSATGTVYKGLALANDGTGNFLFVADFHHGKVDVYDSAFNLVSGRPFTDPDMPAGFAPFNIKYVNGQLYIIYAKQDAVAHDDVTGPGNGYVDIFTTKGVFSSRFTSQGPLNSPWGITPVPSGFGQAANAILISNYGDGAINVFSSSGSYQGQLKDSVGNTISISGLWGIGYAASGNTNQLFFTAGPDGENHGLFGYVGMK